ncbi:ABC transporter ATP-binding protein [Arthrobacter sp. H14]|uniref:ABC transporter ATP-binding protein n=1 Tax=Arthrobacter sp. H14 TaxID=1312959 RepID=UPI0004B23CE2|nr:ABC transporter ATP-binding protein [Arthrobacter sp. H14]
MNHLQIANVAKTFHRTEVLTDVSLTVHAETTTAIVGPSGSGKTTLLRLIAGFTAPDAGSISIGGTPMADGGRLVPAHRRNVGYVAQDGALFPHLSVGRNIAFGLTGHGKTVQKRVDELLEMVSLEPSYSKRQPHELSGGQQQRVALARALAKEPQLMLLDEPFSSLDAGLRVATRKAVAATLRRAGVTTVLVTHDQGEALSFADQVAVMRAGRLTQTGSPFVVYTRPADRQTAEFLGDAVILDAELHGTVATCCLGAIPVKGRAEDGPVQLMLRPEQIRVVDESPVRGTVVDSDYFGPETTVRIQLHAEPETITIRHWNALLARPGEELCLRVVGEAVVFPES